MKFRVWYFLWWLAVSGGCCAQEEQVREISAGDHEQRMLADRFDQSEDEEVGLHLDHLLRFRLAINTVRPERLLELPGITPIHVRHFTTYRAMLGPFTDVMELQAIPSWDPETVRRIMPYVKLVDRENPLPVFSERLRKGEHLLLLRTGASFRMGGDLSGDTTMKGGPLRNLLRYNYRFGQLMQWGMTTEKDPGEPQWQRGRGGPDFVSGHVSVRELGVIRSLVLGDFQVSLGQGLIHWQGISFGMGSDAMSILRQAPVLRPYNGTDENRFHRGGGLHLRHKRWDAFIFHSSDRKDANLAIDSVAGQTVRSVLTSGLHRTEEELVDRDALQIRSSGAGIRFSTTVWHAGWQGIRHEFGHRLDPEDEPYRKYAIRGNHWWNHSLSWGGTIRNMHLFGEGALDLKGRSALLQGMLLTLHRDLDISLLYRQIDRGYRAWQADAHTAQGEPMNEAGWYAGGSFRPVPGVKLDGWVDICRFPMLKYRLDAPSFRRAQLLSLQWQPDKRTRLYWRWQGELAERNLTVTASGMRTVKEVRRITWRWHMDHALPSDFQLRFRADASRVEEDGRTFRGGLLFIDLLYKPPMAKFRWTGRFAWYDADDFSARLFAYEHDVPFQQSMAMLHGRGVRMYMVMQYKPDRKWQVSLKTGLGLKKAPQVLESDVRLQVVYRYSED
jgi:hypothetical protein